MLVVDLLVWSNPRVIRWLERIGLHEYAGNLSGNGVHGALLLLDPKFDADAFALSLQIPMQHVQVNLFKTLIF